MTLKIFLIVFSIIFFPMSGKGILQAEEQERSIDPASIHVENPYKKPNSYWNSQLAKTEKNYCGVKIKPESGEYQLKTFTTTEELDEKGFHITHKGSCGTCSSMQDLKVYITRPDLTTPVRKCAALTFRWLVVPCLRDLGFSNPCIQTWYYNIAQTRKKCSMICIKSWWENESFNKNDGKLNSCLQCDEDESGPAFKVIAGRTRRRSGIVSAIKRSQQEFFKLEHDYLELLKSDN